MYPLLSDAEEDETETLLGVEESTGVKTDREANRPLNTMETEAMVRILLEWFPMITERLEAIEKTVKNAPDGNNSSHPIAQQRRVENGEF